MSAQNNTLLFKNIKSDFVGDNYNECPGLEKISFRLVKHIPKTNKGANIDPNKSKFVPLLTVTTEFKYDGVVYNTLEVNDIIITGFLKSYGFTPLTNKKESPEFYNFTKCRDIKAEEAYNEFYNNPANSHIYKLPNGKDKPAFIGKKYASCCMEYNKEGEPIDTPLVILKLRALNAPKYIYSCVFDIYNKDGTLIPLRSNRKTTPELIAKSYEVAKSQFLFTYGQNATVQSVTDKLNNGEFVSDVITSEDIGNQIKAYSVIKLGAFELSPNLNVQGSNNWINCDLLPIYMAIKVNEYETCDEVANRYRSKLNNDEESELNKQIENITITNNENNNNL